MEETQYLRCARTVQKGHLGISQGHFDDTEDGQSMYVLVSHICVWLGWVGVDDSTVVGKIMNIPIYATTQNQARLGSTVPEIADLLPEHAFLVNKTAFSMVRNDRRPSVSATGNS